MGLGSNVLYSGGADNAVKRWDINSGKNTATLNDFK